MTSSMPAMSAVRHHRECGVTCHVKCPIVAARRLTSPKHTKANQQADVASDSSEGESDEETDDTSCDVTRVNNCTCTVRCVRAHAHLLCMRAALKAFAAACWSTEAGTYEIGGPSKEHTSCVKARAMIHGDAYLAKLLSTKVRLLLLINLVTTLLSLHRCTP
jgi:hypothetical protein